MVNDNLGNDIENFSLKVLKDISGTFVTSMCAIGDELGLFKDLVKKWFFDKCGNR